MNLFVHFITAASLWRLCYSFPYPDFVTGNTMVHDPTLCKDNNGTYWLFSTGSGLDIRTSTDRINWQYIGAVWPQGAPWTDSYTGGDSTLWAPDCTIIDDQFILYYAASTFGSIHSGIFLARSSTGLPGSWTNEGLVIDTNCNSNWNAIDPNLIIEPDRAWYLSAGSFWTGIKELSLNTSGLLSSPTLASIAQRPVVANNGAMEASVIFRNADFYYLFTSWDNCCEGINSTYNIRVGRSSHVAGPYVDKGGVDLTAGGGTLILGSHDNITGPGGQDLMNDTDGPILVYHYYTSTGNYLGINSLDFSSGWPVVV